MKKKGIVEWAMRNRQIIFLLTGMLIIVGIYSLVNMPKQEYPTFTIRQGVVIGVYPGASSLEIEQQVTKPLERYLFTFPEVNRKKTHSQSKDGIVFVFVELADEVNDKNIVWSKIKHGINTFKSSLPSGVVALIANDNFGDVASLLITLESEDKTYRELDGYLDGLENRLRRIPSVANANRYGIHKEQISIYLDNDKLSAYGMGANTIMFNLFAQGFITSSGSLDNDKMVAPIHIAESYRSEQEIAEQVIYSSPLGDIIRVKDIARIVREYPEANSYITNNGKKCILLSVEAKQGENIVVFGKDVDKILSSFQEELPESVSMYRIADQPKVVSDSVNTFLKELLLAIIAVILVTMILLPFRVALVAATSIPISIAISLGVLNFMGIPLNMVTLASLILVMGMIVDNSVVIVDSYIEKLDHGMSSWKASVESAKEYFKSIFSATLAISITFFPFLITVTGTTHDFLLYFPWTITVTLAISLITAMLIIPPLQHLLIRKGLLQAKKERRLKGKKVRKTILDYMQVGYEKLLAKAFEYPKVTMGTAGVTLVIGIILFSNIPQRMMPVAERDQFAVEIYLPQGSSLKQTAVICDSMEAILRRDERVKSITAFVGESSPRFHMVYAPNMPSKAYGQFIVNTTSIKATEEMLDEYTDMYAFYFPEAYVRFKQLDFQAVAAPVEVRFMGEDINLLKEQAEKLMDYFNSQNEFLWVRTNFEEMLPGAKIEIDPVEAGRLGINRALVSMGVASGLTGSNIATLWEGDYALPVAIKQENGESDFSSIGDVHVSGLSGSSVPLRQVADIKPEWNQGVIAHRNGMRTICVLGDLKRAVNPSDAFAKVYPFMDSEIIPNLPTGVDFEYGGEPELVEEVMIPMSQAILIAIFIIFIILLFHFQRLNIALLVLSSSLLSLFGAAFGVWIMGIDFSVTAMLGIVSLIGIIVRNGIIMFDYIEVLRTKKNMSVKASAIEAGKRRMRPIFLTSAAASMGVLPMIISKSLFWSPLGTVIFFGTLISMVLVVTVLPVAYWLLFRKSDKKRRTSEKAIDSVSWLSDKNQVVAE